MEEQATAYVTTRIHRRIDDQYIVSWWKYNPSQCTLQSTESLESSPLLLKQFDEYEKGMRAIIKCLEKENRYLDEYRRKHVNLLDQIISDDDWDRWVVQYPSRYHKKIQEHKIGYWTIKAVELEWMKILDPNADHYGHPLYLESFDAKAPPPKFQFIKNYIQSELVERCLNSQLIKKHQCVFGPRESFCQDCRQRNQVQRLDQTRVQLPDVLSNMYLVVCGSRTCGCHSEGPCNNFLPVGARGAPMVVFYERRYEGYGVRAITSIPKGTIMSEYVGRLFTSQEEYVRDESYILETETGFMVDTKMFGNEARFFGSSCSPSLEWVKVFVRGTDMQDQYRTVFVTNRDLKPGEELSIDYHSGMNKSDRPKVCARCRCGSKNCRGWV